MFNNAFSKQLCWHVAGNTNVGEQNSLETRINNACVHPQVHTICGKSNVRLLRMNNSLNQANISLKI